MKMIRNSLFAIGVIIAPFAMQTTANAAPLSAGFSYNYTTNVLTDGNAGGLSWLSLNETRGRSVIEISSKLGANQEFDGFRYATYAEMRTLTRNWSLSNAYGPIYGELYDNLIPWIGDTYGASRNGYNDSNYSTVDGIYFGLETIHHEAFGYLIDPIQTNHIGIAYLRDYAETQDTPDYYYMSFQNAVWNSGDHVNPYWGSYLVRSATLSTVPLPTALPLYGAGLAVMGFIGWRRKRKA